MWSFQDLQTLTQTVEQQLKQASVQAGDILAIRSPNHALHLALFFACETLHLILAPFYDKQTAFEFENQLAILKPEWLLSIDDSQLKIERFIDSSQSRDRSGCLFQTSGTTGTPGFIFKSFKNLFINATLTLREQAITANSNIGCILSFSHVGGMCMQTTGGMLAGSELTLIDRYQLRHFSSLLKCYSHSIIVPSYFHLLKSEKTFAQTQYENEPVIVTGSTVVTKEVFSSLKSKGLQVQSVYGLTEVGPYACVMKTFNEPLECTLSCLGSPLPEYQMRIQPITGEIETAGPCVGEKYFPPTQQFLSLTNADGFLPTGDQGHFENGKYYFKGRLKNLIFVGGFKINPIEVEQKMLEHAAIQNCAVIAKAHETMGEIPVAYVVGDSNQVLAITQFLKMHLSSQKVPREIHFVDALPETSIGKNHLHTIRNSASL